MKKITLPKNNDGYGLIINFNHGDKADLLKKAIKDNQEKIAQCFGLLIGDSLDKYIKTKYSWQDDMASY